MLCEFHKQECTFVEKAQPRKRKLDDGTTSTTAGKTPPGLRPATAVAPQTTVPQSQTRVPISQAPAPSSAISRKPYAVDESLSLQRHRHCKLLGHATPIDASLIGLGTFSEQNETESRLGRLRQVNATVFFTLHDDADVPIPDDEARALAEIETIVGQHGPALIDIYFRNVHPSYPIIQKTAFLDRHRHGDRQFNPPLLAAMYLLALSWWESDPVLASLPKPDTTRLEYIAISSLRMAMQRPKMSAVQAGLLLLQRAKSSTWTLIVQLVALAQDIGLHLDCSDWSIPLWERRLRKRLAWALYMQDKWSALQHGRPSHINPADWAIPAPIDEDFDDTILSPASQPTTDDVPDAQTLKGRIIFMQMIALTSILSEVTTTFYSCAAKAEFARAGPYATQLVLNRAKPVQLKLKNWFATLPPECKMDATDTNQLSSTGYLHLGYFATEISIHRRIVQSLDPATGDPYMLYICRSAAKTRLISAMDFVNRLRSEHLEAFWYFSSACNFALIGTFGALLQATSPGKEEAEFYASRLREFRWTLSVSAKKASWIASAVEMLDANEECLVNLPEKPTAVEMKTKSSDVNGKGKVAKFEERSHGFGFGMDEGSLDRIDEDEGLEDSVDGDVDYGVGEVMEIDGWSTEYA